MPPPSRRRVFLYSLRSLLFVAAADAAATCALKDSPLCFTFLQGVQSLPVILPRACGIFEIDPEVLKVWKLCIQGRIHREWKFSWSMNHTPISWFVFSDKVFWKNKIHSISLMWSSRRGKQQIHKWFQFIFETFRSLHRRWMPFLCAI